MTIKHLQEVDGAVNRPGVEVSLAFQTVLLACGLFLSKISTPSEVMLMLLKPQLVVTKHVKMTADLES